MDGTPAADLVRALSSSHPPAGQGYAAGVAGWTPVSCHRRTLIAGFVGLALSPLVSACARPQQPSAAQPRATLDLDAQDSSYAAYLQKVRNKIRANWSYPREAGERRIEGDLLVEFQIAKNGHLEYVTLKRTSGKDILDFYAINAVKFAAPFPPLPDAVAKESLTITGAFRYQLAQPQ